MTNTFITILNISITASYIALAAMMLRLMLKKNPKWISCLLWALVAIRLLVPFSFESKLSLIPDTEPVKAVSSAVSSDSAVTNKTPVINNQVTVDTPNTPANSVTHITPDKSEDNPVQDISPIGPTTDTSNSKESNRSIYPVLSYIWIGGAGCMLAYSVISYLRIKARVRASIRTDKNIYICDNISTPFILGVIKPKIYLPSALWGDELRYITNHEKAHLRRCDHLWKPLGFLLLSIHWFNPVMWLAYILLCRDIELACDEKVLKEMGTNSKKHYSETLLTFSTERRLVSACPLAFGEVGVKQRIKNILNYKKPAFWVILLSLVLCVAVGLCFLTNPVKENENSDPNSDLAQNLPEILPADCITDNYILYTYQDATNSNKTSHIKLYPKDESFEFMINPLSSYLPMGTYAIEGNTLILDCDDDNQYVFEFLDSYTLMFIENESSELPVFKYSADDTEATKPFYDGTRFSIENTQYKGVTNSRATAIPYTYEEIVETIIDAYPWNRGDGSSAIPDFPHASYMYRRHNDLSEIGYALIDLDKNGVDELVISGIDRNFVYDVYTKTDDTIIHLFSSGERYTHTLYENGYVHLGWSGGAGISGHDFMKLTDGNIEFIERITLDAYYAEESGVIEKLEDAGSDNCFFKSTSRNTKNYVHISDDEALELIDTHKNKTPEIELVFAPFSTYTPGDIGSEVTQNRYVEFDIDSDGENEICNVVTRYNSANEETPLSLMVFKNDTKEYYTIPDVTIDTTRNTATNFYLKTAGGKLYLFLEENICSRIIYELSYENGKLAAAYTDLFYDITDFDIDGDTLIETLSIINLPIFPYNGTEHYFAIKAEENRYSYLKYYNEFELFTHHDLRFEQEDGKLYLVTTTLDALALERKYEVSVDNDNIVLNCDGDKIPYNELNTTSSYIIDQMKFDIDGDGKKEDVTVTPGSTSGIFSIKITAQRDEKTMYESILYTDSLDFNFERDKDGTVYLIGRKDDYIEDVKIIEAEIHKYKFEIWDSKLTLIEFKPATIYSNNGTKAPFMESNQLPYIIETLNNYAVGYETHNVEILNSCFDHTFIDPRDKEVIDDLVNTVTDCKIESVKFIEESDDTVKFHVTYEITYNEDYLGVGNRLPGYNLVSADFIFTKVSDEYLISSMDLEGASHIR